MKRSTILKAREIIEATLDVPVGARAEFVSASCGQDDALRVEVESLLASLDEIDDRLSTAEIKSDSADDREDALFREYAKGESIADYEIKSVIGKGGTCIVYLADQLKPFNREVALKILNRSDRGADIVVRFHTEQQTLALLDHPNVATVFDAGTTDEGFPYFVMEYINGETITQYGNHHHLTLHDRLELFLHICEAVHYCHNRGVVHCDLKPGNILVTQVNSGPFIKIIDFGIAFALLSHCDSSSAHQPVGTPMFSAPEQITNPMTLDNRSDVYSLGILLGQFIEPVRHECSSRRLIELEWIITKATAEKPDARYSSADHFMNDINHWIENEPVTAAPPIRSYRVEKFVRKHRWAALAFVGTIVLMTTLIIGLWWGLRQSHRNERLALKLKISADTARKEAEAKASQSRESLAMMLDLVAGLDPWITGYSVNGAPSLINTLASHAEEALQDDPVLKARADAAVGCALTSIGDYENAEIYLQEAFNLWDAQHTAVTNTQYDAAWALADASARLMRPDADDAIRKARRYREIVIRDSDPILADVLAGFQKTMITKSANDISSALDTMIATAVLSLPDNSDLWLLVADAAVDAALELYDTDNPKAEMLLTQTLAIQQNILSANHPDTAITMSMIGDCLNRSGKPQKALNILTRAKSILNRTLPAGHPAILIADSRLGECYLILGLAGKAQPLLMTSEAELRKSNISGSDEALIAAARVIRYLEHYGKPDEASPYSKYILDNLATRSESTSPLIFPYAFSPHNRMLLREPLQSEAIVIALQNWNARDDDRPMAVVAARYLTIVLAYQYIDKHITIPLPIIKACTQILDAHKPQIKDQLWIMKAGKLLLEERNGNSTFTDNTVNSIMEIIRNDEQTISPIARLMMAQSLYEKGKKSDANAILPDPESINRFEVPDPVAVVNKIRTLKSKIDSDN